MRAWFHRVRHTLEVALLPLAGRPLRYLEIGVCVGYSLAWVLENVLTHPDSRAVGVDIWKPQGPRRSKLHAVSSCWYEEAVARLEPWKDKVELIKADSKAYLPTLPAESFDIVYIDGDHQYDAVMSDSREALRLVSPGGVIGWDDCHLGANRNAQRIRAVPEAFADFMEEYGQHVRIVFKTPRQRWAVKK